MDATWRCLREHGYDGTTVRRLAARLECSVGHIYRLFPDKQELLLAVTQRVLEPVLAILKADAGFDRSLRLYHHCAMRDMEAYRLMFWLAASTGRRPAGSATDGDGSRVRGVEADGGNSTETGAEQGGVERDDGQVTVEAAAPAVPPEAAAMPALPRLVRDILDQWTRLLGDRELAQQCWSLLHGALMLGYGIPPVLNLLQRLAPSGAPSGPRQLMDADASPERAAGTAASDDPGATPSAASRHEYTGQPVG